MKGFAFTCSMALAIATASTAFAGQQSVQTVRELYASAAYEEALAAVDRVERQPEVERYRMFSLTALGRKDEAQKVMEALIHADPMYVLNPADTPPRVQEAFEAVRKRLLPDVAKQLYLDARASLERKDREGAIAQFERLLKIVDAAGPAAAAVADLRILASGFLDLSKALPVPTPASAPTAAAPSPAAEQASAQRPAAPAGEPAAAAEAETRPIPIRQELPAWVPPDALARTRTFAGIVRIRVGTDGRVEEAEIVRPAHPAYDAQLVRAARNWLYEPATRNGVAVVSELSVEVNLTPRE